MNIDFVLLLISPKSSSETVWANKNVKFVRGKFKSRLVNHKYTTKYESISKGFNIRSRRIFFLRRVR